jgi:hypothetical protein
MSVFGPRTEGNDWPCDNTPDLKADGRIEMTHGRDPSERATNYSEPIVLMREFVR